MSVDIDYQDLKPITQMPSDVESYFLLIGRDAIAENPNYHACMKKKKKKKNFVGCTDFRLVKKEA